MPIIIKKNVLVSYKKECIVVISFATALFMLVSLLSFNAHDPSWFYYHTDVHEITNKCGVWGAQCAALLMYLLGAASLLVPFFLMFYASRIFFQTPWRYEWDRVVSFLFFIPTCAALNSLYRFHFFKNVIPGGRIGISSLRALYRSFDAVGSFIILHALALVFAILIFRISFLSLSKHVAVAFRFLMSKKYLLTQGLSFISRALTAMYTWTQSLWQARDVLDSEESIVLFEGAAYDELKEVRHEDLFPQNFQASKRAQELPEEVPSAQTQTAEPSLTNEEAIKDEQKKYAVPEDALFEARDQKNTDKKIAEELKERAKILEEKLARFGISGSVTSIKPGPVVTLFEYEPHIDTKISKIISLEDDLALALQALSIRIIAPIPGRSVVGFEVANQLRKSVYFSSVVQSKEYKNFSGSLPLVLGEDTTGSNIIVDLVKMPHLLVAGSTGSGKSVALNTMLISLLCSKNPDELKLILIDPKRLEFAAYADIAHLLFPIITDPRKAVPVLKWVVQTMEARYERMAHEGARTITDFNTTVPAHERLPYIVVVIDELADLMMTAGTDVENLLTRLSQMARAAGIHLILATQRPSVDIVTGLIKVNFPSRISFKVTSKVDSRTILDVTGAEKLLGKGDMLFLDAGSSVLARVHGAYVSDKEILAVINHIRSQRPPAYLNIEEELAHDQSYLLDADDELYQNILSYLNEVDEVSISMLQRRFRIGYNRSARIIEALESQGKIMPADGSKARKIIRS
jgi:S-DNA-T family DNA segregation ATPase FtsK/SpoIIIE